MNSLSYVINPDEMWFYGQIAATLIVLVLTTIASTVLLRKDRSLASAMLAIGAIIAVTLSLFDRAIFVWITDWTLTISEEDLRWKVYLSLNSIMTIIRCVAGISASFGGLIVVIRYKPSNR